MNLLNLDPVEFPYAFSTGITISGNNPTSVSFQNIDPLFSNSGPASPILPGGYKDDLTDRINNNFNGLDPSSSEAIYGLIYDMVVEDDQLVKRLVLADDPPPSVIEDQRRNRLLPIEMSVLTIGYELDEDIVYGLALRPPLNLDPVYLIQSPVYLLILGC